MLFRSRRQPQPSSRNGRSRGGIVLRRPEHRVRTKQTKDTSSRGRRQVPVVPAGHAGIGMHLPAEQRRCHHSQRRSRAFLVHSRAFVRALHKRLRDSDALTRYRRGEDPRRPWRSGPERGHPGNLVEQPAGGAVCRDRPVVSTDGWRPVHSAFVACAGTGSPMAIVRVFSSTGSIGMAISSTPSWSDAVTVSTRAPSGSATVRVKLP